jgi:SOS response regulatory protein OraA/RecX
VPTITALREVRRGQVAVELDDAPWRELPIAVVVRAELRQGLTLDRPTLRLLRRELRRREAMAVATRALRVRDLPTRRLAERLERAAVPPAVVDESLAVLENAGLVDDGRFAANRALSLAGRGYGDAAIRHDLERQGIAADLADAAIAGLEPEGVRARRLVALRGSGVKTARYLVSKGFADDTVEAALGPDFATDP